MEFTSYEPGVPSWVDHMSADADRAAAFYGTLFGWACPEGPAEFGGYRVCTLRGKTVAGIGGMMDPAMPAVWSTYVATADAEATAAAVTANGGSVIAPPMQVGSNGTMAVFADPAGAVFGVWQADQHIGAELANEPGSFCWNDLQTTDVDGAQAFYGAVFGWGFETADNGTGPYWVITLGGRPVGGMMPKPPGVPDEVPPMWMVYFTVEDTDVALVRIGELGGATLMPPIEIPAGRFAVAADPLGAVFGVIADLPTG